jgi:hypothetical protein
MKTKNIWITSIITILMALFTGSCKDENIEVVGVCPVVISTNPENEATNVSLDMIITATFNEKMNYSTISQASFTLSQGSTPITGEVTYSDVTASFSPSSVLNANTTYTARLTSVIKDLTGNALQTDYIWTFSTGATLSPTIISTDPENNAIGVFLNKAISATFSNQMNPLTLTAETFSIKQGLTIISGAISYSGNTVVFTPSANLVANTLYSVTISKEVENIQGISMANDYIWTFTTGSIIAPFVIATDPPSNAISVDINKTVTATFSATMDPLTITSTSFTIEQAGVLVSGIVSCSGATASFIPTNNFLPSTVYVGTITTGAKNIQGNAMANKYVWTFTTGSFVAPVVISTDPANNETNVVLNKTITAVFNVAMDPLTISVSTFVIKQGATVINGAVSYTGTTATFIPASNLLSGVTYTATINTGAKNVLGTSLVADYVWTFNTVAPLGPIIIDFKSVAAFGIFAGVGVSNNTGQSEIHDMDIGVYPGIRSDIVGFPPAITVNGSIYASDDIAPVGVNAMLMQAQQDLIDAYITAEEAILPTAIIVSGDQGGKTFTPGIYKSTSTISIQSGNLTLDAQGDVNAVWIIQVASVLTTVGGAGGDVILAGGAQAKNVFWQSGGSATIGDFTSFKGNLMALTSITMNANATIEGRILVRNGTVFLSTNIINKP